MCKYTVMTTRLKTFVYFLLLLIAATFTSCYTEDPGPIQETEKEFTVVDFDRLEMGDAFHITVEQGDFFSVSTRGDRRNIDDLDVRKEGSTLIVRYNTNRNRNHDTYVTITMPSLISINFSGASNSKVSGFRDLDALNVYLSGASVCQLDADTKNLDVLVSGASYLNLHGAGEDLKAELSGASVLKAFNFPVIKADLNASGASDGNITVSDQLNVVASGASTVLYRGNPSLHSNVSGASSVRAD
jgi:hypothetical protein